MASGAPEAFMLLSSFSGCLLYISPSTPGRDERSLLGEEAMGRYYSPQVPPRGDGHSSGSSESGRAWLLANRERQMKGSEYK